MESQPRCMCQETLRGPRMHTWQAKISALKEQCEASACFLRKTSTAGLGSGPLALVWAGDQQHALDTSFSDGLSAALFGAARNSRRKSHGVGPPPGESWGAMGGDTSVPYTVGFDSSAWRLWSGRPSVMRRRLSGRAIHGN
jgi:hypothetical protein